MSTIYNHLRRAYTRVQKGWTQNVSFRDPVTLQCLPTPTKNCMCCLAGSVIATQRHPDDYLPAIKVLQQAIGGPVTVFNDNPFRSKDEVLDVLKRAINNARKAGV